MFISSDMKLNIFVSLHVSWKSNLRRCQCHALPALQEHTLFVVWKVWFLKISDKLLISHEWQDFPSLSVGRTAQLVLWSNSQLQRAYVITGWKMKDSTCSAFFFLTVSRFYMKLWSRVWLSLTDALDSPWYGLGPALFSLARASVHWRRFVRSFCPSQSKAKKSNFCLGLPSEWWSPALLESGEICQTRGRMSSGQVDSCCPTMDQLFQHYEGRTENASQTCTQILFIYWGESFSSASYIENPAWPMYLLKI